MKNIDDVICPPCGEQPLAPEGFYPGVALATKRGATKESPILPLLPRLMAVLPPQGREIISRGFTLIELLIVVLIIGILAAVAVPQYQKAVWKTRLSEVILFQKQIMTSLDAWILENGWPTIQQLGEDEEMFLFPNGEISLNMDFPHGIGCKNEVCEISYSAFAYLYEGIVWLSIRSVIEDSSIMVQIFYERQPDGTEIKVCQHIPEQPKGKYICDILHTLNPEYEVQET